MLVLTVSWGLPSVRADCDSLAHLDVTCGLEASDKFDNEKGKIQRCLLQLLMIQVNKTMSSSTQLGAIFRQSSTEAKQQPGSF